MHLAKVLVSLAVFFAAINAAAQSSGTVLQDQDKGVVAYSAFQGSSSSLGQVFKWDTSIGYNFNEHVGVDVGVPIYFVNPSSTSSSGAGSTAGAGNAYLDLRLTFKGPVVNYLSTVTVGIPTGNTDKGLSTGRATVDWNNHFDRSFGRLTPYVEAGVANTVSDTSFFTRPFSTLGLVGHFQGGANLAFARYFRAGAGGYAIVPSGEQKLFSKLVQKQSRSTTSTTGGSAMSLDPAQQGPLLNVAATTGGTEVDRDHGYSLWVGVTPNHYLDMELAFTRSERLALNTLSVTVGVNLKALSGSRNRH